MNSSLALLKIVPPVLVPLLFIALLSRVREQARRQISALSIAGAGAVYFGGSFGVWEVVFCVLLSWVSFRALKDYRYVGLGWTLHVVWDLLHHLYGRPILPFVPFSSAGCAICDTILAIWYFAGAPSIYPRVRNTSSTAA